MIHRRSGRVLLIVAAFAFFLVPVAAIAAGGFTDVDDDSVFVADIQWMKDNGVTKGCNPPTNDRFCPGSNVTREQMSAFMHRLAANKIVDAKTAVTAESAATALTADSATTADDADLLDGKDSDVFVEHGEIVLRHGGNGWTQINPTRLALTGTDRVITETGSVVSMALTGPATISGVDYALKSVEYCISAPNGTESGTVQNFAVFGTDLADSGDDYFWSDVERTTTNDTTPPYPWDCFTLAVNDSAARTYSATVSVKEATNELNIGGLTTTWAPVTTS